MTRRNFSQRVRRAAFERAAGLCENCGCDLAGRRWDVDHVIPDWMGGEPTLANAAVLCAGSRDTCHGRKSASDAKAIAKTKRLQRFMATGKHRQRKSKPIRSLGFRKSPPQNTATRRINKPAAWRES